MILQERRMAIKIGVIISWINDKAEEKEHLVYYRLAWFKDNKGVSYYYCQSTQCAYKTLDDYIQIRGVGKNIGVYGVCIDESGITVTSKTWTQEQTLHWPNRLQTLVCAPVYPVNTNILDFSRGSTPQRKKNLQPSLHQIQMESKSRSTQSKVSKSPRRNQTESTAPAF